MRFFWEKGGFDLVIKGFENEQKKKYCSGLL